MIYYILLPGDTEADTQYSTNILGEDSGFGTFWAESGFFALTKMVELAHEQLDQVKIKDSSNKNYTIEQFLSVLKGLKIKYK
jgi:hypothetical protein